MSDRVQWISYRQLARDLARWSEILPRHFDAIVGMPIEGNLIASMLGAQILHPVHSVGERTLEQGEYRRVLLVVGEHGDCGYRAELEAKGLKVETGAPYWRPSSATVPDHVFELTSRRLLRQWSWLRDPLLERATTTIDGVLTEEPEAGVDDDGPCYREYLKAARARHLPGVRLRAVVTTRLEKYRDLTKRWLGRQGVLYYRDPGLVMMAHKSKAERVAAGRHCEFKASVALKVDAELVVEANPRQAKLIARLSDLPVLCTADMRLY